MHTKPMADSEGEFGEAKPTDKKCHNCGAQKVVVRIWESSCGGYEDEQFTCTACGHHWWVDGIDS